MTKFTGSGRVKEGGFLGTHKSDFIAHTNGTDWQHDASHIVLNPPLDIGTNVQSALENIVGSGSGQGFVSIGTDSNNFAQDLGIEFTEAFANPRLVNGGVILVKAGLYSIQSIVTVPLGITIFGEAGGTTIIGEMNEEAIFLIQKGVTKNYVQPGVIQTEQYDETNRILNIKFYDNLNGVVASGAPSMSTVPFIQMEHGAQLYISDCDFIGKALTGPVRVTHRVVAVIGSTTPGVGTVLHMKDCYIDGVKTVIDYEVMQGDLDYLVIDNNRARTFGDGALGSIDDRYFVALNMCNATIINNFHKGLNTTWNAAGLIYFKNFNPSNSDFSMNISGNYGGLDTAGFHDFLTDGRTTQTPFNITADNTWGNSSRDIKTSTIYEVQNSDFGTTLTFQGLRVVLDCRTVTTYGAIGFNITNTPLDGEELDLSIINHATRTPSIVRLNFNSSLFFKNTTSVTDNNYPDPRPGGVTRYKFAYNSISESFDLISKTVSVWSTSSSLPYDARFDELKSNIPQRSYSIMKKISASSASTYDNIFSDPVEPARPIFLKSLGILIANGDDDNLIYTENGSDWGTISMDSLLAGGTNCMAADNATFSPPIVLIGGSLSSTVRKVTLNRYAGGPPYQSIASTTVTVSGNVNAILYQGYTANRFLIAHSNGISFTSSPYTAIASSVLAGNNIIDMARAPDGRIMAISSTGVWLHNPTPGDFTTLPSFASVAGTGLLGTFSKVSYNRVTDSWFIITETGSSDSMYRSANNGSTFSNTTSPPVSPNPGVIGDFQMVGNVNVISYKCNTTGFGGLFYFSLDYTTWQAVSISNTDGAGFVSVGWVAGKLIAMKEASANLPNPIAVCSIAECGMYNPLDFDK